MSIKYSILHKCGDYFKSTMVYGLAGVNSEICEQFNSYLPSIKYNATHLSQADFMFFTHFLSIFGTKIKPQNFKTS